MLLRDLTIENYRSFEKYKLDGFGRVNLLVGDNNSGKTSVLEAVHILISQGKMECALETLGLREAIKTRSKDANGRIVGHPDAMSWFRDEVNAIEITRKSFAVQESGSVKRRVEFSVDYTADQKPNLLVATAYANGVLCRRQAVQLDEAGLARGPIQTPTKPRGADNVPVDIGQIPNHLFVPSHGLKTSRLAQLWAALLPMRSESSVVRCMNVIDAEIRQIQFSPTTRSRSDIWVDHTNKRLTLANLGEGAVFLLSIGVALASSQHGLLFVDEIDTGLHYSKLSGLWRMVIKAAKDLDVQVFATTHSLDCIRAIEAACDSDESLREDVALFSIDRRMDEAVRYAGDELSVVVEHEIEVR